MSIPPSASTQGLDPRARFGPDGGGRGGEVVDHANAVDGGKLTFRCAAVVDHHGCAFGGKAQGNGLPQPARPACPGDQRRLARKPAHQATLRVVMKRGASAKDWNSAAILPIASVAMSRPNWSMSATSMISTY